MTTAPTPNQITACIFVAIAALTVIVGIYAYEYRLEMKRLEVLEAVEEACIDCDPRADPDCPATAPPDVGSGTGHERAGGGAPDE